MTLRCVNYCFYRHTQRNPHSQSQHDFRVKDLHSESMKLREELLSRKEVKTQRYVIGLFYENIVLLLKPHHQWSSFCLEK